MEHQRSEQQVPQEQKKLRKLAGDKRLTPGQFIEESRRVLAARIAPKKKGH